MIGPIFLDHAQGPQCALNILKQLSQYFLLADGAIEPYRTMLKLLPLSGLRIGEMCQLAIADVEVKKGWGYMFLVREGSGQEVKSA